MADYQANLQQAAERLRASDAPGCQTLCSSVLGASGVPATATAAAYHLRGLAAAQLGQRDRAVADLRQAWQASPQNHHAALWLGRLLRQQGLFEQAVPPLQKATERSGFDTDAHYELGRCMTQLQQPEQAMQHYQQVLELMPRHADAAANLAFLLERANKLEEAGKLADQALQLAPGNFMANLTRATIDRRQGRHVQAQVRLAAVLRDQPSVLNRSITLNQMGQSHDQQGDYPQAFDCFSESNLILRNHHPCGQPDDNGSYGIRTLGHLLGWLQQNPPSNWSANNGNPGKERARNPADSPVFLVGFPRSGTTLLHQALAAHPDIEVLEELEFLAPARLRWLEQEGAPGLANLKPEEIRAARDEYLASFSSQRKHPQRRIAVDKLPLNIAYLALIHRLFPAAHIILALRDPRDACLSCFFQTFELTGAMPYFLDLMDTARYYDQLMRLATSSLDAISNPRHTIRYEQLVDDFTGQMQPLISFLGLDWDERVMNYRQQLQQHIATPSYHQVAQPLYTRSIGRWKNYQQQMEPAQAFLTPWVARFGYSPA